MKKLNRWQIGVLIGAFIVIAGSMLIERQSRMAASLLPPESIPTAVVTSPCPRGFSVITKLGEAGYTCRYDGWVTEEPTR